MRIADDVISTARILIVDDEPANVRLLERLLASGGYTDIRGFTDPREALTIALETRPDLVLLDLQMPHLDGFEFLRELRESSASDEYLPVLVLTADTTRVARERALSGGAKDFLTKPIDRTDVLLRTRNLLETRFLHLALRNENRSLEAKLLHQAFHDELTGLPNRALFRDRVTNALARTARGDRIAVMILDLDDFKSVNDRYGHAAGDRVLTVVGERLLTVMRGCDTVARLGGDEYAIVLVGLSDDHGAALVAQRIRDAIELPIEGPEPGTRLGIQASIGIAFPQSGETADEMVRNADLAMYRAKEHGNGGYSIFQPGMREALVERLEMEADLREATERGEILVVYQPIVHLESGAITGVEALARWRRPGQDTPPSAAFIPLAEETGLIVPIGRWVLREACRDAAGWLWEDGDTSRTLSVNLSPRQLHDPHIVGDVAAVLAETGFPAERLILEITESVLVSDTQAIIQRLHELRALGVRMAIDDFGAGYCSLGYLQRLPFDILKIDRSFVTHVADRAADAALASSIVNMAATLNLRTVAEGVESSEQRSRLIELGCASAQGYLFSRPITAALVRDMIQQAQQVA